MRFSNSSISWLIFYNRVDKSFHHSVNNRVWARRVANDWKGIQRKCLFYDLKEVLIRILYFYKKVEPSLFSEIIENNRYSLQTTSSIHLTRWLRWRQGQCFDFFLSLHVFTTILPLSGSIGVSWVSILSNSVSLTVA